MMLAAAVGAHPAVYGAGVAVDVGADKVITHRTGHPSYGNFAGNACTASLCRRSARVQPERQNLPKKQENHARPYGMKDTKNNLLYAGAILLKQGMIQRCF